MKRTVKTVVIKKPKGKTQSFGERMAALRANKGKKPAMPMMKKGKKLDAEDRAEIKAGKKPTRAEERAESKKGKKGKNFIAAAIKKPGSLRATAGVKKGQKIPKDQLSNLAQKPGVTGRRARFAQTLEGFNKGKKKPSEGAKAYAKRVGMKGC